MLPASGVYPRDNPRPTGSRAEVRVYQALREKLPAGWYAWHSLRVQTREGWCGRATSSSPSPGAACWCSR